MEDAHLEVTHRLVGPPLECARVYGWALVHLLQKRLARKAGLLLIPVKPAVVFVLAVVGRQEAYY